MHLPKLKPNQPTLKFYIDGKTINQMYYGMNSFVINQPEAVHRIEALTVNSNCTRDQDQFGRCQMYLKELKQFPPRTQVVFINKNLLPEEVL